MSIKHYKAPWFEDFYAHRKLWWFNDLNTEYYTDEMMINTNSLDLMSIHQFMSIALSKYESYFIQPKPTVLNYLNFPHVVSLKEGDSIINTTRKEGYTVEKVFASASGLFSGAVLLSDNAVNIESTDNLEIPSNRKMTFFHDFPFGEGQRLDSTTSSSVKTPEEPFSPTVTYRVINSEPATINGRQQVDLNFLREVDCFTDPSYKYEVYSRLWDNLLQYNVWTQQGVLSDYMISLFTQFMTDFTPVLRFYGVHAVLHKGRTDDRYITRWRPDIVSRSVNFFYRTEEIRVQKVRQITSFIIKEEISREGIG